MDQETAKQKFIDRKLAAGIPRETAEKMWDSSEEKQTLFDNKRVSESKDRAWPDFGFCDMI